MASRPDPQAIIRRATETTGLSDFGDPGWEEGLERLLYALKTEAALSSIGTIVAIGDVTKSLAARLAIVDWANQHPEVRSEQVQAPIVIVGAPRTGTTILHQLLGEDPRLRVPLTWEVENPCPPPEAATYDTDPRIAQADTMKQWSAALSPELKAKHPVGPLVPHECLRLLASDFKSLHFTTMYRVPSYGQWIASEADMGTAYRWHRHFLQHLQSRYRCERWALKSPFHLLTLDALLEEYPDAVLVQTHRDPVTSIASAISLSESLRAPATKSPDRAQTAAETAGYFVEMFQRSVEARQSGLIRPDQVVDLDFRVLQADPVAAVRSVYSAIGWSLDDETEERMRVRLEKERAESGGAGHQYSLEGTGLDAEDLRARTRGYAEYFDL